MKPRKLKSGSWTVQVMVDGTRYSVTADTKSECVNRANAIKANPPEKKPRVLTWAQAIDMFIKNSENILSPSTIKTYRSTARNHYQDIMHKDITDPIIWQIEINKDAEKCGAKCVKNNWGLITAVMNFHGITPPKVRLPQVVRNERPFLDVEQAKILMNAVRDKKLEIPVLLMLNGLRRSEALALKKADVDLKAGSLHVHGAVVASEGGFVHKDTNKNTSSNRVVPILIPRLEEVLKDAQDPLVRYAPESIAREINKVCAANGLPRVSCHGLRHTMCSFGFGRVSELSLMKFGGWSTPETMRRIYTHISDREKNADAEAIRCLF